MAWSPVYFQRLYYKVAGGTEYELTGNSLTIPPVINYNSIQVSSWLASLTSNNLSNTGGYYQRGNNFDMFFHLYGYNGGRGTFNLYYFWGQMSVGQDILIYKESGNSSFALVLRKKASYQFEVLTKWGNTYTSVISSLIVTSTNAAGTTHTSLIDSNACNVGFVKNGNNFRLCFTMIYGQQNSNWDYDANSYRYNVCVWSQELSNLINYLMYGNAPVPPPPPSTDPYDAGGTSTTDPQGTGDFDDSSDAIAAPAMTSLSPIDADFIKLYKIDKANLTAFAQYLFSTSFTTNMEKMWNSVSEAILCLNLLPFTPAGTASTATDIYFDSSDSNADGYLITQQYEELDFGSVVINEFYGSCLDYTPYTQIQLSLPYAQTVNLDPDEFMGRSVGVKCRVDVYTGSALYLIDNGTSVLMQVPATLANPLPWSAKDYSAVISSIANLAITVGGGLAVLATGGASTPAAIAIAGGVAANTASNVMQAKPHYQHGGSAGMGTGIFGIQKPYLIIKRPRQCLPVDNNKYQGYPSMATLGLGNLTGFTKVLQIHLDNLPATDAEKKELETILKGGVWF